MNSAISKQARYQRLKRGWSVKEARNLPKRTFLWQRLIMQEEGQPVVAVFLRQRSAGLSLSEIARSFEIHRDTLRSHLNRWRIEGRV